MLRGDGWEFRATFAVSRNAETDVALKIRRFSRRNRDYSGETPSRPANRRSGWLAPQCRSLVFRTTRSWSEDKTYRAFNPIKRAMRLRSVSDVPAAIVALRASRK